jgi:transcriptional regulator with XRE-family HTH domain
VFYPRFVQLCEQKDVKKTRALLDAGLPKSAAKYWEEAYNKGIDSKPTTQNAVKLANYFGVTVDYLLNAEKENAPGSDAESEIEKALAQATPTQRELISSILDMNENQLLFVKELVDKAKKLVK